MPYLDYDGSGVKREYAASVYTFDLYEETFGGDLIKDIFGKVESPDDDSAIVLDFSSDNWTAELHAFWCMLKTADAIASAKGVDHEPVPPYARWVLETTDIDIQAVSGAVVGECFRRYLPAIKKAIEDAGEGQAEPEQEADA